MDNVTFLTVNETEHAIIDHGNEQFTSMPKSEYDRRQAEAEHFTPSVKP
jgi:hypothetical protein